MVLVRSSRLEERRGALPHIAEIALVWPITEQRGEVSIEGSARFRRIDEPLILEGPQPSQAIADDEAPEES